MPLCIDQLYFPPKASMSHASTATITLGSASPSPIPAQQDGHPLAQQNQAGKGRRRRRENVPEHMKHADGPASPVAVPASPTTVPYSPAPALRAAPAPAPGGMTFATVYKAKPNVVSSTPDAAFQAQTLFAAEPQKQQRGDILYGVTQPVVSPAPAPVPVHAVINDADARRAEEARQKLAQLNLSPAIVEQYRRKFNVLDLNKDGVVNLREFAAISRVLGYKFSKEEILEIFGRRDLDDSGGISFDEFVIAMYERAQKTKQLAPYREKFRLYDWKGRGYITSEEAYPVLKKELGFDENKTEMMIYMFDRNKDYRLSLLEFIDFYKKVEELKLQVQNAFRDFDRNGDGFVDANEAKAVLIPKGFSDQQVDALIFKYDRDADGMLNYREFAAFWDVQLV